MGDVNECGRSRVGSDIGQPESRCSRAEGHDGDCNYVSTRSLIAYLRQKSGAQDAELARLRGLVVRAREIARMVPKSTAPTEEDVAEAYSFLDDSEGIE
jgi:hypothetical protein